LHCERRSPPGAHPKKAEKKVAHKKKAKGNFLEKGRLTGNRKFRFLSKKGKGEKERGGRNSKKEGAKKKRQVPVYKGIGGSLRFTAERRLDEGTYAAQGEYAGNSFEAPTYVGNDVFGANTWKQPLNVRH